MTTHGGDGRRRAAIRFGLRPTRLAARRKTYTNSWDASRCQLVSIAVCRSISSPFRMPVLGRRSPKPNARSLARAHLSIDAQFKEVDEAPEAVQNASAVV